jgi:hypothetical protein
MKPYANCSPEELAKTLQSLEEKLAETAPNLMEEIALVKSFIARAKVGTANTYATVAGPKEAVQLCLELNGDFKFSKYDMATEIIRGGYRAAPKAARGVINVSINYYIKTGYLTLRDGLVGRVSRKKR